MKFENNGYHFLLSHFQNWPNLPDAFEYKILIEPKNTNFIGHQNVEHEMSFPIMHNMLGIDTTKMK